MPRKILINTCDHPYHITNRSNNREFFYLDKPELWEIFLEVLAELPKQFGCQIHAFVMMSNHYHLLISTPKLNLGEAMKYFQREVARKANRKSGRINHFFGGRYKWSLISQEDYYWNSVKYLFRNPIRGGLCSQVQDYKYSSLNSNGHGLTWEISDFFQDRNKIIELDLNWLNEPFQIEVEQAIKKGLRRREFKLLRAPSGQELIIDAPNYKKGASRPQLLPELPAV